MYQLRSHIARWNLTNQRVLLRVDLNIPLSGNALHDHRLQAIRPTIDLILSKGGSITLATHLGRPHGVEPALSTKQLVPWFEQHGYPVQFESDIARANAVTAPLTLLENLRFFPGEKNHDEQFAHQLAQWGDVYVNDAFALVHRTDSSITTVPALFEPGKRTIGLLMDRELEVLNRLLAPRKPFIAVLGGGKVQDKLPLLAGLTGKADKILLCPALVFTFLKALGKPVGKSLVDDAAVKNVKALLDDPRGTEFLFPVDFQIALGSLNGPISYAQEMHKDGVGISIGPETIARYSKEIQNAGTVFLNGMPGLWHRPETLEGIKALLHVMSTARGYRVIGGGDSVAVADELAIQVDYCSTGGGATLAYLAGEKLPGLEIFSGDAT